MSDSRTVRLCANASVPTSSEMSWISCFVSRLVVERARSWDSLACTHGCEEMCTLGGDADAIVALE